MPREIWNEGRVVGYSAYEIYVKHFIAKYGNDPDKQPASEQQWLASSIGNGSAMLLKLPELTVPSGHQAGNYWFCDIAFPSGSKLVGSNTIYASLFLGQGHYNNSPWADRVANYSYISESPRALRNDGSGTFPVGVDVTTQQTAAQNHGPVTSTTSARTNQAAILQDYMSIVDAVIIQPGTWTNVSAQTSGAPQTDLTPNFTPDEAHVPVLRLVIQSDVNLTHRPEILLTGFTISSVIEGVSGTDGSTNTNHPEDGDFLGPAVFPWASKVIFTLPTAYVSHVSPKVELYDLNYTTSQTNKAAGVRIFSDADSTGKKALALTTKNGTDYTFTGSDGEIDASYGKISWSNLLDALANNKKIDAAANLIANTGTGISVTRSGDNAYVISVNLTAGTGISISGATISADISTILGNIAAGPGISVSGTSTRKIAANLSAGNGISVSGSTDGQPKTITANVADIVAGPGIAVNRNNTSGVYTVSNSLIDSSAGGWLTYGTDYTTYRFNNFRSSEPSSDALKLGIKLREVDSRNPELGYVLTLHGTAEGYSDPKPVITNSNFTRSVDSDSTGFHFYHSGGATNGYGRATLFAVRFLTSYLADSGVNTYNFIDTSDYMTGIWNIRVGGDNVGGSWGAVCKAYWIADGAGPTEGIRIRNTLWLTQLNDLRAAAGHPALPLKDSNNNPYYYLVVRADSYIDGYNSQFWNAGWMYDVKSSIASGLDVYYSGDITATQINLTMSGQFLMI